MKLYESDVLKLWGTLKVSAKNRRTFFKSPHTKTQRNSAIFEVFKRNLRLLRFSCHEFFIEFKSIIFKWTCILWNVLYDSFISHIICINDNDKKATDLRLLNSRDLFRTNCIINNENIYFLNDLKSTIVFKHGL